MQDDIEKCIWLWFSIGLGIFSVDTMSDYGKLRWGGGSTAPQKTLARNDGETMFSS